MRGVYVNSARGDDLESKLSVTCFFSFIAFVTIASPLFTVKFEFSPIFSYERKRNLIERG